MYAITYEPVRRLNSSTVEGGITHAVDVGRIEDIRFWGDMARICLVSGAQFNVTRSQAISILDVLDKWRGGASKAIAEMEDAGRGIETARNGVAKDAGKR